MPSAWTSCVSVQAERGAGAGRRAHRAEHGGGVEAGFVHGLGHDGAEAADDLGAHGEAAQDGCAAEAFLLGECQHGGNDDGAGVDRAALEGVVEVLAMRGGAVDEGGAGGGESAAWAMAVAGPGSGQAARAAVT